MLPTRSFTVTIPADFMPQARHILEGVSPRPGRPSHDEGRPIWSIAIPRDALPAEWQALANFNRDPSYVIASAWQFPLAVFGDKRGNLEPYRIPAGWDALYEGAKDFRLPIDTITGGREIEAYVTPIAPATSIRKPRLNLESVWIKGDPADREPLKAEIARRLEERQARLRDRDISL